MSDIKLCVDCKSCELEECAICDEDEPPKYNCHHINNIDLVTGKGASCTSCRLSEISCGKDGKYWEEASQVDFYKESNTSATEIYKGLASEKCAYFRSRDKLGFPPVCMLKNPWVKNNSIDIPCKYLTRQRLCSNENKDGDFYESDGRQYIAGKCILKSDQYSACQYYEPLKSDKE